MKGRRFLDSVLSVSVLMSFLLITFSASDSLSAEDRTPATSSAARPKIPKCVLSPEAFAARYRAMAAFRADSVPRNYLAIGTLRGYMYVLKEKDSGFALAWSSFYLGSPIRKIVAEDIDADGTLDLVVVTSAGRMFVFDSNTRQLVWENTANDFMAVTEFVTAQLDDDPALELILCADSRLIVMDGEKLLREHYSSDEFKAEYMVIGDVDDDDEREIVLDSGFIVNARTLNIEWQTDFFGTRLNLLDVDADGVEELVCESSGGALRIYDLDTRQEKTVF